MSIPPKNKEDAFIDQFVGFGDVSDLKDNSIAIDATYYLSRIRGQEPLVTALGGPMAAEQSIIDDLDSWKANDTTPLFIFDGCLVKGEYEQTVRLGLEANYGTEHAWNLYAENKAQEAVTNFGTWCGAYRPQSLYPLLQAILRKRDLHYLVAPSKAVAQIAYFSREEIMCGAIMGPRELLLYPIKDAVIQEIDWESNRFTAIDRNALMNHLGVDESILVDALLITGCSFLPAFPARAQPHQAANTVRDAVNMLRTNGKHVKQLCSSFDDVLMKEQPDWFEKFCKARMIVKHYIYINEDGAVEIANDDALTTDSHEYLGIKLPEELIYYMEYGLVGPNVASWVIHSEATVPPTLDGIPSTEYKNLVLSQLLPIKELALGLVVPRLNRGLHYKNIEVKAWMPNSQPAIISNSTFRTANPRVATWDIEEKVVAQKFPSWSFSAPAAKDRAGSIAFEILSLLKPEFSASTINNKAGSKTKTDSAHHLVSSIIWRFLHLRDYVDDSHELTPWGKALAASITHLEPTVKKFPKVSGLFEALLLAFELIRFDQLNSKPRQDEIPQGGSVDESVLLASRCAVLLKLRHEAIGYTGPLRKDMLAYLSQVSAVRDADRDLVDSITAHLFLNNKSKRNREPKEHYEIADALPFVNRNHNAAMGVAVRTYLEQRGNDDSEGPDMDTIAMQYFPKATNLKEDFEIFLAFFSALTTGVKTLGQNEIQSGAQDAWSQTNSYLQAASV